MEKQVLEKLATLRMVVGFLGEKEQHGWWTSSFFGTGSAAFLAPLFPRTQFLAQCEGSTAAAARIHDERIGIGEVFHLFRLPEDIEQGIHRVLQSPLVAEIKLRIANNETAIRFLRNEKSRIAGTEVGPIHIANIAAVRDALPWNSVADRYADGFERNSEAFPYFADRK